MFNVFLKKNIFFLRKKSQGDTKKYLKLKNSASICQHQHPPKKEKSLGQVVFLVHQVVDFKIYMMNN